MDEEELQKRFTDCVYFLASPLTCKKGIECEYRHSEIARLNPRDCWFWLGGCCFNPDCAFRHPPLEGLKEAYHEPYIPSNGPTLPVDKSNTPCYYYSKGICNKGERCPFLHGPPASTTVNNPVLVDKGLPAVTNVEPPPVTCHPDPPETAQIEPTHTEITESTDVSATECDENGDMSDSLVPIEEFVHSGSDDVFDDHSSDQPAFDVLVDCESERRDYEEDDDADYLFKVKPVYPESGNLVRDDRYDVYDRFDDRYEIYDQVDNERAHDKVSAQSRESIFYRLSFQKRNVQSRGPDLRQHLKKRTVVDFDLDFDRRIRGIPQRHVSRGDIGFDFDHRIRGNTNNRRYVPRGEVDFHFDHRSRFRKTALVNRYRPLVKDSSRFRKPWFLASPVSRSQKPAQRQTRKYHEESAVFRGPKTLDEIKEEKKNTQQDRDFGSFKQTESNGFQGPRPLSEILEKKRKLA